MSVGIESSDRIGADGLSAILAEVPWVELRDPADCDVVIVLTDRVGDDALEVMRRVFRARPAEVSCVLITDDITEQQLSVAAELGVVALLHRAAATPEQIVDAIALTRSLKPALPREVLPHLLRQFHAARRGALTERERRILRLYADGLNTAEVARQVGVSTRMVNLTVFDVVTRRGLRNRTHAVAYALRQDAERLLDLAPRSGERRADEGHGDADATS